MHRTCVCICARPMHCAQNQCLFLFRARSLCTGTVFVSVQGQVILYRNCVCICSGLGHYVQELCLYLFRARSLCTGTVFVSAQGQCIMYRNCVSICSGLVHYVQELCLYLLRAGALCTGAVSADAQFQWKNIACVLYLWLHPYRTSACTVYIIYTEHVLFLCSKSASTVCVCAEPVCICTID